MFVLKFLNNAHLLMEEYKDGEIIIDGQTVGSTKVVDDPDKVDEPDKVIESDDPSKVIDDPSKNVDTIKKVTIDSGDGEVEYELDVDGNATLNGEIVFTKQQLDDASIDTGSQIDLDNIHTLISEISGLELTDSEGKVIEFESGIEGLAQREVLIKNIFYEKGLKDATSKLLSENQDIAEMYEYKRKHGSLDGYVKQVDYSTYSVTDETSEIELKSIYKEYLLSIGNDTKTADKLIKLSEQDETLKVDAIEALEKLKESNNTRLKLEKEKEEQEEREAIEKYENYYGVTYTKDNKLIDKNVQGSIYDKLVKSGKIGNIAIPQEGLIVTKEDGTKSRISRLELFNYFYKPVKEVNGTYYTQSQIDENNRLSNTDEYLIQGIRNLTKNDISSLEKNMKNIINLKDAKKVLKIIGKPKDVRSQNLSQQELNEKIKSGEAQIIIK